MKYKSSTSSAHLLQRLSQLIEQLAHEIEEHPNKSGQCFFSPGLFTCLTHNINDYLSEIYANYHAIRQRVTLNQQKHISFLSERLINQIAALTREIATRSLNPITYTGHQNNEEDIYQKLARHQDYQRRLHAMIRDKQLQLSKQLYSEDKIRLQREIATYDNRLARCQYAIKQIERQIECYEN